MPERNEFVETPDGRMETFIAHPDGPGPFTAVVMYQNVGGLSDLMRVMAWRVAAQGYYCAVPDLYYRLGKIVIDADSKAEPVLAIRKAAISSVNNEIVMADTRALLDFIARDPIARSGPKGTVGYCMGGRFAVLAAGHFPGEFRATASLFGVGLITDAADSPHLVLDRIQGEIYCGFAEHDPTVPVSLVERFGRLLGQCPARSLAETHPGSHHGYAFPGRVVYQREAAEKSWERIFSMFRRQFEQVR